LNLKGILIDFGDTLAYIDKKENQKYEEALLSTLRSYGYLKGLNMLSSSLGRMYWNSTKGEIKDFHEFWKQLLRELGIPSEMTLIRELEEVRKRHYDSIFKLYEGAVSVLSLLEKKYKLALVSNCAVGLSGVVEHLGLTDHFDCIILSYEVGARKPNARMYFEALKCLKLEPYECVFVADEISDLEGAKEVGLKTLLVLQGSSTTREAKDPNFKPDFRCQSLSGIAKFL